MTRHCTICDRKGRWRRTYCPECSVMQAARAKQRGMESRLAMLDPAREARIVAHTERVQAELARQKEAVA